MPVNRADLGKEQVYKKIAQLSIRFFYGATDSCVRSNTTWLWKCKDIGLREV